MLQTFRILGAVMATGFLPALALPAPQMSYYENSGAVGGVTPTATATATATGVSGSLYGNEELLGGNAAPSPVQGGDSAIVSNYELVSGQEADTKLGLYLDFNSVEKPQPFRGSGGQTDPGPSKFNLLVFSSSSLH